MDESSDSIEVQRATVGPFRVEEVIGRGGMGVVYRARDAAGNPVAIKLLHKREDSSEPAARRFAREAKIRIEHPNVVGVIDAGTDPDGCPWIAFELLEGESLRQRLSRGVLEIREAVELATQVCSALAAAHAHGIVHRDLKPSNLFVCADGRVKLLDFGVARWSAVEPELTATNQVIGTPSYLAPEQARGDSTLDARVDLWALGVVLYEALTSRKPFKRESAVATMLAIVLEDPVPIPELRAGVPQEMLDVVGRCLAKDRKKRFQSAEEIQKALLSIDLSSVEITGVSMLLPDMDEGDGGTQATVSMRTTQIITEGEQRVVAMLLARGVRNAAAIERAVAERDGVFIPLLARRQAIGLFGGEAWEGDEIVRAASAALVARGAAEALSVASGRARATGAAISGDVVLAAEAALTSDLAGVAVAGEAARLLRDGFALRELRTGTYEITEGRRPFWPLDAQRDGSEPKTIGRTVELEELRRAARRVLEEQQAATVVVTGPPGIGKSRLRQELERMLEEDQRRVLVITGRAEPLRREAAYALLTNAFEGRARLGTMLRGWPRIDPEAPVEERQRGVLTLVLDVIEESEAADECAAFIGELLGVPMPENAALAAARRDPQLMADRLHMAVIDYFTAACESRNVALLLDDLQWADDASLGALDELVEQLQDRPFLLLGTARPELDDRWPGLFAHSNVTRVRLQGLTSPEVAKLAGAIAGRDLSESLLKTVVERTGGNPLFVEQIVTELRDRSLLDSEPEDLPLPLTVEAAVQSRLDHLPRHEKDLIKRASIYGRPFTPEECEALGIQDAEELLVSLAKREFVAGRARLRGGRGREYRFRSSLVPDVAYRMLADELRSELHRRAALMLDARPGTDPEEVAWHCERGGQREEAARRYADAALAAARRGDSQTVLRCSTRALYLDAPKSQRFALHMARADALRFLGRRSEQAPELDEALTHASNDGERAHVLIERAVWMSRTGRTADAISAAEAAVAAASAMGDREVLALARGRQATVFVMAGRLPEAETALDEAKGLAIGVSPQTRAFIAEWGGLLANAAGDLGMQVEAYRSAVGQYEEVGDVRRAAGAENNVADAYNRVGAYADAEQALRATVEKCRRVGNHLVEAYALVNLGYALAMQGRHAEALEQIAQAEERAASSQDVRLGLFARLYRARTSLHAIEHGGAVGVSANEVAALAEKAADEAEGLGLPGVRALALAVAARARLAAGDREGALARASAAMSLRDQLGSLEEDEAHVFVVYARALEACGRADDARRVRARGLERLESIAQRIRGPEWRERFLRDVDPHRELLRTTAN